MPRSSDRSDSADERGSLPCCLFVTTNTTVQIAKGDTGPTRGLHPNQLSKESANFSPILDDGTEVLIGNSTVVLLTWRMNSGPRPKFGRDPLDKSIRG